MSLLKMNTDTPITCDKSDIDVHLNDMIEYLIENNETFFKSQQRNEKDLTDEQKRNIAREIFNQSKSLFLSRFGKQLKEEHLRYFEEFIDDETEGYDLNFYIKNLRRYFRKRKTDVKNRRYGALNKMISDDSYFSETEMMKRNPLLYEQLVGRYMTEDEKKKRDNIDTLNITLVNVLLEGIDRDETRQKRKEQEIYEKLGMDDDEDSGEEDDELRRDRLKKESRWRDEVEERLRRSILKDDDRIKSRDKVRQDSLSDEDSSEDENILKDDDVLRDNNLKMDTLKEGISKIDTSKEKDFTPKNDVSEERTSKINISREGTSRMDISEPGSSKMNIPKTTTSKGNNPKINISITNTSKDFISKSSIPKIENTPKEAPDINFNNQTTQSPQKDEQNDSRKNSFDGPSKLSQKWGEFEDGIEDPKPIRNWIRPRSVSPKEEVFITATERKLLKEEFVSLMYQSFIDGNDAEFDYNSVDNNEEYDNIEIRNCDAEDKYFDSESPEEVLGPNRDDDMNGDKMKDEDANGDEKMDDDSEDELDVYMRRLNQHHSINL